MRSIIPLLTALTLLSCGANTMDSENRIESKILRIAPQAMKMLSQRTIFFGHQSVGRNILDGLISLSKDYPGIDLEALEFTGGIQKGAFLHAPIGKNMDPESKIQGFVQYMQQGVGGQVDIAFFKFCYVDITSQTDVDKLFHQFQEAMDDLANAYPDTLFLHTTVPLTIVQTGPRAWVKRIIGRPLGGYADNIQRNRYNTLLKQHYQAKAPIFDLAMVESIRPDGKLNSFHHKGNSFHALVPEYASDGRHLNETGARLAAAEMIAVLSKVSSEK